MTIYANGIKYTGKVQYEEGYDWKTSIPYGEGGVIVPEENESKYFDDLQIQEEHPKYSSGWSNDNHHHHIRIRIYDDGRIYLY